MSAVEKRKKARATRGKTVQKYFSNASELIDAKADISEIIAIRDTIVEKYNQIKQMDEDIFNKMLEADDENLDAEEETATNFTKEFKHRIHIITTYISSTTDESILAAPSTTSSSSSNNVRLQKLQ